MVDQTRCCTKSLYTTPQIAETAAVSLKRLVPVGVDSHSDNHFTCCWRCRHGCELTFRLAFVQKLKSTHHGMFGLGRPHPLCPSNPCATLHQLAASITARIPSSNTSNASSPLFLRAGLPFGLPLPIRHDAERRAPQRAPPLPTPAELLPAKTQALWLTC
jgi:hypothetical protein